MFSHICGIKKKFTSETEENDGYQKVRGVDNRKILFKEQSISIMR